MSARECLVIGGGPAGSMAAIALAGAGRAVTLIEKERGPHPKVCGEFLSTEAAAYLHRAGLDPAALGAATIERLRIATGMRTLETSLPFTALSLSRSVLDEALLARAQQMGVVLRRGIAVQQLKRDGDAWAASCNDGSEHRAADIFLATGKHELRGWPRGAGLHGDLVGFKMHWRLAPARTAALRGAMLLFLFRGGYGGLSLVEGDAANLCFVMRRSSLRALPTWAARVDHLRGQCAGLRESLEGAEPLWQSPLAISPIPYGYFASSAQRGLWPVGDQAAVIPSFTGDGMSIALHSGALAARMCLNGASPDAYLRTLKGQLRVSMATATLLSRAMVSGVGRSIAPAALTALPELAQWIATATRIPERALPGASVSA